MSQVTVQKIVDFDYVPETENFIAWSSEVLKTERASGEVNIRIVGLDEITRLNHLHRQKNKPTNVLAFPFANPEIDELEPILGDVVIAAEVVKEESKEQNLVTKNHFAHMTIHGVLHLIGYDHIKEADAKIMEQIESRYLDGFFKQ